MFLAGTIRRKTGATSDSRFFPDFEIVLADLGRHSDEDIRGAVLTRAFLLVLKHVRSPDFPDRMPGIFRLLGELSRSRTGPGHLEAMLRYMARVAEDIDPEAVETLVEEHFPEKEGGKIMATLAEQWERKGEERGIRTGIQTGFQKGIQDGLSVKFGETGLDLIREIQKIRDTDRLREILKTVWLSPSLEDFKKKLDSL